MSSKKTLVLIAFTAAILMAFGFQNSSEHKVLFEKAKFTMETKGDLKGAIKLFNEIVKKYPEAKLLLANEQRYYRPIPVEGKVLKSTEVLKSLPRVDLFINVATAKHHSATHVSLAMKNLTRL